MKYRQNPLPIARRYRLLKSAKADGDVEIGKYPGLVSSSARAFPDCSSDIIVCRLFLTVAGPLRLRGVADKLSTAILAHLFRPLCVDKSST